MNADPPKLSIIVPVYNEGTTLKIILVKLSKLPVNKEIIIVDDGSTDSSKTILAELSGTIGFKLITMPKNLGKGSAIREALPSVTGNIVVIQDADLEYDPDDLMALLTCFDAPQTQVVYGSRILGQTQRGRFDYYLGGLFLCRVTNLIYGSRLTDMTTCYKMMRREVLQKLDLKCRGFEFCAEVTAKLLKQNCTIHEIPIHYTPRTRREGKKLSVRDGFRLFWTLIRERFFS